MNKKEMVNQTIAGFPGGKEAVAAVLGLSIDGFNNRLYEKKGQAFFSVDELEAMASLNNTPYVAEYFAEKSGHLVVAAPEIEELDSVELFDLQVKLNGVKGMLDKVLSESLADGVIDRTERKAIEKMKRHYLAVFTTSMNAIDAVYGEGR